MLISRPCYSVNPLISENIKVLLGSVFYLFVLDINPYLGLPDNVRRQQM